MIYAFSKIRIIISGYVDMCRLGAEKSTSDLAARFRSAGFDLARVRAFIRWRFLCQLEPSGGRLCQVSQSDSMKLGEAFQKRHKCTLCAKVLADKNGCKAFIIKD